MIQTIGEITKITCDKCDLESTAHAAKYNEVFYNQGWGLYPRAKKYQHLCYGCIPKKTQKSMKFIKEKFGL